MMRSIKAIKQSVSGIGVLADVALDPYTSHGQDGVLDANGYVDNDASVGILRRQALMYARSGTDIVAPSDMMEGRIGQVRDVLERDGQRNKLIMSYPATYASAFYCPFRDAVGSNCNQGRGARKRDEEGKGVAVRVGRGGRRISIKKTDK